MAPELTEPSPLGGSLGGPCRATSPPTAFAGKSSADMVKERSRSRRPVSDLARPYETAPVPLTAHSAMRCHAICCQRKPKPRGTSLRVWRKVLGCRALDDRRTTSCELAARVGPGSSDPRESRFTESPLHRNADAKQFVVTLSLYSWKSLLWANNHAAPDCGTDFAPRQLSMPFDSENKS